MQLEKSKNEFLDDCMNVLRDDIEKYFDENPPEIDLNSSRNMNLLNIPLDGSEDPESSSSYEPKSKEESKQYSIVSPQNLRSHGIERQQLQSEVFRLQGLLKGLRGEYSVALAKINQLNDQNLRVMNQLNSQKSKDHVLKERGGKMQHFKDIIDKQKKQMYGSNEPEYSKDNYSAENICEHETVDKLTEKINQLAFENSRLRSEILSSKTGNEDNLRNKKESELCKTRIPFESSILSKNSGQTNADLGLDSVNRDCFEANKEFAQLEQFEIGKSPNNSDLLSSSLSVSSRFTQINDIDSHYNRSKILVDSSVQAGEPIDVNNSSLVDGKLLQKFKQFENYIQAEMDASIFSCSSSKLTDASFDSQITPLIKNCRPENHRNNLDDKELLYRQINTLTKQNQKQKKIIHKIKKLYDELRNDERFTKSMNRPVQDCKAVINFSSDCLDPSAMSNTQLLNLYLDSTQKIKRLKEYISSKES